MTSSSAVQHPLPEQKENFWTREVVRRFAYDDSRRFVVDRHGKTQNYIVIWLVFLLFSGQGLRNLMPLWAYIAVCVLTVLAVVMYFRFPLRKLDLPQLLIAYVAVAILTLFWSATPTVSAVAVVILIATTYVGVAVARTVSHGRFIVLLHRGLQVSVAVGLLFELFVSVVIRDLAYPLSSDFASMAGVDPDQPSMAWSENRLFTGGPIQGFVGNRNPFGAIALMSALAAGIALLERRIRLYDAIATMSVALFIHLLTGSATITITAIHVAMLALGGVAIRRLRRPFKKVISWGILAYCAVVAVVTLKYRDYIFGLFDRSADLSHRSDIWKAVMELADQRPEGWGFVSYWPTWLEPYKSMADQPSNYVTHAHNAFLDAWLQLGVAGAAILLAIIVLLFGSAWRLVERANRGDTFIPLGWALLTVALAIQGLTESRLLSEGSWFLVVVLLCSVPPAFTLRRLDPEYIHNGDEPRYQSTRTRPADSRPAADF